MHDNSALSTEHHDAVTQMYAEEMIVSFQEQMREAESLAGELHNLLTDYESTLAHEGLYSQVERLISWAARYRLGLQAADRIFQTGQSWLGGLQERLLPVAEEPSRPGEPTNSPVVQMNDFTRAGQQSGTMPDSGIKHVQIYPPQKRAGAR